MAKSEKTETKAKELKEKLFSVKKNAAAVMSEAELKKCDKFCEGYKSFLDAAKTEREATAFIRAEAESKGFVPLIRRRSIRRGTSCIM